MKTLFLIPARGGSKGIPYKNIKPLNGKPLIYYTIDVARQIASDVDICVSTDSDKIIQCVECYGLQVPFKRPKNIATDTSSTYEVILHALDFYAANGIKYESVVLLQPTSPFRKSQDVIKCIEHFSNDLEMVVSVKNASANPYYNCYEVNKDHYLVISKGNGSFHRRQDAPKVYEYNGAVYVMNTNALIEKDFNLFQKVGFVEMDDISSLDIDTPLDWEIAEYLLQSNKTQL